MRLVLKSYVKLESLVSLGLIESQEPEVNTTQKFASWLILWCLKVDYMEPTVEKITLVEDARFDSPKSMFLGRVMGNYITYQTLLNMFSFLLDASIISY